MSRQKASGVAPDWYGLRDLADRQAGYFTTADAKAHDIGSELLIYYLREGGVERPLRGIYRFAAYPSGPWHRLVLYWLWSDRKGVYSHSTALRVHNLAEMTQDSVCMSVPVEWETRRITVPEGVHLHYENLPPHTWEWCEQVPVTTPLHTVVTSRFDGTIPPIADPALGVALARGLFTYAQFRAAEDAMERAAKRAAKRARGPASVAS